MSELMERVRAFFAAQRWPSSPAGKSAIEVSHLSGRPYKSLAHVHGGGPIVVYDSHCPEIAPPEHRAAVARFITRVNNGLLVGAFEMDWDEGAIRCRTSINLGGAAASDDLLYGLVIPNHQAMIDYLPNLLAVLCGEQEPDEAYEETLHAIG